MAPPDPREERYFEEAIQLATKIERSAFLDRVCGADAALRKNLEALIEFHEQAGQQNFLPAASAPRETPSASTVPVVLPLGAKVGRYRLREKIAEGGFGVVFLAEQEEPIVRWVALKVIKLGMDTREVIARFDAERQALALMDHPNIAKVLDAGATEAGRPYFVMEWIQGVSITEHCDDARLSIAARLELFGRVCSAVQHAHQRGIVHRDLKPSNVMIALQEGVAVPKIIDFGIAKAIDQRLTDQSLLTRDQQLIGTPAYMSPEQASGGGADIDTRSDIYSLGVLLYQLLAGVTPLGVTDQGTQGYAELCRRIREEDPLRPSARLGAMRPEERTVLAFKRRLTAEELPRKVHGDLDWIVLKALAKERTRRYESASEFAQDIAHFLRDEPVSAAAPSRVYLLKKMARRHRTELAVLAGVGLVLVFSAVFGLWTAEQATVARREAIVARDRAERESRVADVERNRARLLASRSDRLVADHLLKQNEVPAALLYLARSLRSDPGNSATFRRLLSTLAQRHLALNSPLSVARAVNGSQAQFDGGGHRVALLGEADRLVLVDTRTGEWLRSSQPLRQPNRGVRMRFTRDGTRVVTFELEGGALRVWDCQTGHPVGGEARHAPAGYDVAITPDDRLIVTTGGDGRIRFWDPATVRERFEPVVLVTPQKRFGLAANGTKLLVPQGLEDQVELWDIGSDRPPRRSESQLALPAANFAANTQNQAFLGAIPEPSETFLINRFSSSFGASATRTVLSAWNVSTGHVEWETDSVEGGLAGVAWSLDGTRLLTLDSTTKPGLRSGLTGLLVKSLPVQDVEECWEGPDRQSWIGLDRRSGRVHVWGQEDGQPMVPPIRLGGPGFTLSLDATNRGFRYHFPDGTNGAALGHWDFSGSAALAYRFHPEAVGRFADLDATWSASLWIDPQGGLRLLREDSGTELGRFQPERNGVAEARFARDGSGVVSLSTDRRSWSFGRVPGLEVTASATLPIPGRVGAWGLSADGATVVFLVDAPGESWHAGTKEVFVWRTREGTPPHPLPGLGGNYRDLIVSPDGRRVLLFPRQAEPVLLDRGAEWQRTRLPGGSEYSCGAFSPDGRWLALAAPGAGVRVLDLDRREWIKHLPVDVELGAVTRLEFSPNSRLLLSTTAEWGWVWDAQTGEFSSDRFGIGAAERARISPDDTRLLLEEPAGPRILDLAPKLQRPPEWFFGFVEDYLGLRLNDAGVVERWSGPGFAALGEAMRTSFLDSDQGDLAGWCAWLVSDRQRRSVSPRATLSLPEHVERLLHSGREAEIREAWRLAPFDGEVMARMAGLLNQQDDQASSRRSRWLLERATSLVGETSAVAFARALRLEKEGRFEEALALTEAVPQDGGADWAPHRLRASLCLRLNRPAEAVQACDRALDCLNRLNDPRDARDRDRLRFMKLGLLRRSGRWPEAAATQDEIFVIPPRDPGLPANLIDLTKFYNAGLNHDWHGTEGANLASLPHGVHELGGVPFEVRGLIQLQCALLRDHPDHCLFTNQYPTAVAGIPVRQPATRLHFLQGSLFGSSLFAPKGTPVVRYVVRYADAHREEIELRLGEHTRDWWMAPSTANAHFAPEPGLEVVWRGLIEGSNIGLFKTTWINPRPSVAIESLDLVSAMNTPGPFVLAITAE